MAVPKSLPEIWTSPDLAKVTGRSPRNVTEMSSRGLLAAPTHNYRGKPAWVRASALDWFKALHDHAVIVPASDLARCELRTYGIYMCPMSSDHVGLARPKSLVMYDSGGSGRVFDVAAVETVKQAVRGTRQTSLQTRQIIRDGAAIGVSGTTAWTVFYLKEAGAIATITPVIQQGRYISTSEVQHAMASHTLVVPRLDKAFPAQW
jgi:hypothetical protein